MEAGGAIDDPIQGQLVGVHVNPSISRPSVIADVSRRDSSGFAARVARPEADAGPRPAVDLARAPVGGAWARPTANLMSSGTTTRVPSLEEFEARVGSRHEPPVFRAEMVPRPELTARLVSQERASVVVLSAPPGYGKTTLLSEWAALDERPFAWVTVGRNERDGVALLIAVTEALAEVEPATSSASKMMNARVPHIDAVLPTLLDALRGPRPSWCW